MTDLGDKMRVFIERFQGEIRSALEDELSRLPVEERAERLWNAAVEQFVKHKAACQERRAMADAIEPGDEVAFRTLVAAILTQQAEFWGSISVLAALALKHLTGDTCDVLMEEDRAEDDA